MTTRLCPRCGYRGQELQGDSGLQMYACPSCRGDLYTRPPRSYAEMEGLEPVVRQRAALAVQSVGTRAGVGEAPPRRQQAGPESAFASEVGGGDPCAAHRWKVRRAFVAVVLAVLACVLLTAAALAAR